MPRVRLLRWLSASLGLWLSWTSTLLPAADPGAIVQTRSGARVWLPTAWEQLSPAVRAKIGSIVDQPTIAARSGTEEFLCSEALYQWLLDHPDRVSLAWRQLGVPAVTIRPTARQSFSWTDSQGSELVWKTVARGTNGRVWYAEGFFHLGVLLPKVPVKAVAVLQHTTLFDPKDRSRIRHSVEVYLQTDSAAAKVVMKLLGPSAPRMAHAGATQLLLFFSGIAQQLERRPDLYEVLVETK